MNPLISIILPVKNEEKSLSITIESLLAQTFKEFELIIINDGSTDKTSEIIEKYRKTYKEIISIYQNEGLTRAIIKGVEVARGKYIARQDSGDVSYPERLQLQKDYLEKNVALGGCFTWVRFVDSNRKYICDFIYNTSPKAIRNRLLAGNNIYTHGSVLIRKDILLKIGGYDATMKYAQDFELWLRFIKNGYLLGAVPEILYERQISASSITFQHASEQQKYRALALERFYNRSKVQFTMEKKIDNKVALHKYYLNLYFRARNRALYLDHLMKLIKLKSFNLRDILRLFIILSPIDYRFIFKYF